MRPPSTIARIALALSGRLYSLTFEWTLQGIVHPIQDRIQHQPSAELIHVVTVTSLICACLVAGDVERALVEPRVRPELTREQLARKGQV